MIRTFGGGFLFGGYIGMIYLWYKTDTMKILLDIPDLVAEKYSTEAKIDKRSRKNMMEKVLIDYFNTTAPNKPQNKAIVEQPKISTADGYYEAIKATRSADEIKGIIKMAQGDPTLTTWQKSAIERNGLDKIKML